jgi:hypothetical protein
MCAATSGTAFSAADDTCSVFWRFSLDMDEEQEYVIMKGANERQLVFLPSTRQKRNRGHTTVSGWDIET